MRKAPAAVFFVLAFAVIAAIVIRSIELYVQVQGLRLAAIVAEADAKLRAMEGRARLAPASAVRDVDTHGA